MRPDIRIIPASQFERYARVGWRPLVRVDPYAPSCVTVFEQAVKQYGAANIAISDDANLGMVTVYVWENFEHSRINNALDNPIDL